MSVSYFYLGVAGLAFLNPSIYVEFMKVIYSL